MKYSAFIIFGISSLMIGLSGCEKFLEIAPPKTQLTPEVVFNDDQAASSALTTIYARMLNDGKLSYRIPLYTGIYADELTSSSNSSDVPPFYSDNLISTNSVIKNLWMYFYRYIYNANAVLEGVKESNGLTTQVSRQIRGEALFIRAFNFFYLINLFGDVPLTLTTDYETNRILGKKPVAEIYQTIIKDLLEAKDLLSDNFVGTNSFSPSSERIRVCKYTAYAFLARVYLYTKNYSEAASYASKVISKNDAFRLEQNLDNISLKNNTETLWQLETYAGGTNTVEGAGFIITTRPLGGENRSSTLSSSLLSAFEPNDKRKTSWAKGNTATNPSYYFPFKYKVGAVLAVTEYSSVFRLAEQYLIRSEARFYLDDVEGAKADVNVIRSRAGLPAVSTNDRELFLAAILKERQTELFTEWGHRWFDLKRTGNADKVMNIVTPLKGVGSTWSSYKSLWPIPASERSSNPNLIQNTGYN